jgi:hypothetical protein
VVAGKAKQEQRRRRLAGQNSFQEEDGWEDFFILAGALFGTRNRTDGLY